MSESFLVLHGWMGSAPPHWQSWLVETLRTMGHAVAFPDLPDRDVPQRPAWSTRVREALDARPDVVICHSLGCLAWLDCVATGVVPRIPRVLLVAPPGLPELASLGLQSFSTCVVDRRAVADGAALTRMVCTNADPYCAASAAIAYAAPLGIPCDLLEDAAGHINVAAGFGPWPQALGWCLGERESLDGRL